MKHIFIFVFSILITVLANTILLVFSKNLGTRGKEVKQVRWASTSKPSLGGFGFYLVFLGIMAFIGIQNNTLLLVTKNQLLGIFGVLSLGFFIGFADDTYNTNPMLKFVGQFSCAILLFLSDIQIHIIPQYPIVNFLFTSLWVVGLMNSINMLDNMDAITGSSSAMIIIGLIALMYIRGFEDKTIEFTLFAILASVVGFLYHNWYPAKMYMGDAGSQFLGIFLATFSIILVWGERIPNAGIFQFRQLVFPALLFIIPLIDTITVTYNRIIRGQSPFVGGKDHTTHHLVYFGFKEIEVAYLYIFINTLSIGLLLLFANDPQTWGNKMVVWGSLFFVTIFILIQVIYFIGKRKQRAKTLPVPNDFKVEPESVFE
jgi:UDP-GlcNAc:undecaprenyl-phosphate GlcNAc-1-phosphate transferase